MYTVACMLCLNMRALRVFMMPPLVPGPDSVDTPVPGPGSQESWTLPTTLDTGHWTQHLVPVFLVLTTGTGGDTGDTWSRPGG